MLYPPELRARPLFDCNVPEKSFTSEGFEFAGEGDFPAGLLGGLQIFEEEVLSIGLDQDLHLLREGPLGFLRLLLQFPDAAADSVPPDGQGFEL